MPYDLLDILYLNKQRLTAMEELKKVQEERDLLLEKIEQLEAQKQTGVLKCGSRILRLVALSSFRSFRVVICRTSPLLSQSEASKDLGAGT